MAYASRAKERGDNIKGANVSLKTLCLPLFPGVDRIATMNISPKIISLIDGIKSDQTHGASGLARQAANVLKVAAEHSRVDSVEQFLLEQRQIAEKLISARPVMAPIYNIVSLLLSDIAQKAVEMDLPQLRQFTISKAAEAVKDSLEAVAQIAEYGFRANCRRRHGTDPQLQLNSGSHTKESLFKTPRY